MTSSRFARATRRGLVASSAFVVGGAVLLTTGQLVRGGAGAKDPATAPATPSAQGGSADVPMFRGNAAHTGVMPGPGPDATNGVAAIWRFTTEGYISSSPAVADGVAYVGSDDKNLYAIDVADGRESWRFATNGTVSSSPAVVDGVVYVGGDHNLYAIDVADGTEHWRFATDGPISSSPAVAEGVVYFGNGGGNGSGGNLYAIDAMDGTVRWQYSTGGAVVSSPAVVGGVVYVGSSDGNLYAIGARVPRLGVGGTARVTETTALRGGPSATAVDREDLAPGTVVEITDDSKKTGSIIWWPVAVNDTGAMGWVDASKLEPLSSGPDLTPTPTP